MTTGHSESPPRFGVHFKGEEIGLQDQPVAFYEKRRSDVYHLGQVGDLDHAGKADEAITPVVTGALVLVGIFGAVTYRVVNAQTSTATPSAGTTTNNGKQPDFGGGMRGAFYTEQDLATALGITLDKLQTAEKSVTTEALKAAVSAGLITQAQADQLTQGNPTGQFDNNLPFLQGSAIDYNTLLANALGIRADQLQTARQTASFAAIDLAVINGTLTQAQADLAKGNYALSNNTKFQASMKTAYEAAVNQAVSDGVITQAQADQLLSNYSGFGMGGPGGHGGMGMGGHGGWFSRLARILPPGSPPAFQSFERRGQSRPRSGARDRLWPIG